MKLILSLIVGVCFGTTLISSATAQITPDRTTNTGISPTDNGVVIENGDRANGNLFHSFQEFSVPTASDAFFNNSRIELELPAGLSRIGYTNSSPTRNIVELEQFLGGACQTNESTEEKISTFTIKDKEDIQKAPHLPLVVDILLEDGQPIRPHILQSHDRTSQVQSIKTSQGNIYPARGVILRKDGTVTLTSHATSSLNQRMPHNSHNCNPN